MNPRFLRRAAFRTLLVASMTLSVAGAVGAVTTAASAQTNNWYVAPSGHDGGNSCTASAHPCATIHRALVEQAAAHVGGTIHVKAGTYVTQVKATTANDHVTILGSGTTSTIEPTATPTACSGTDPDTGYTVYGIICVAPGTVGFNVHNLAINGLPAAGDSALCSSAEYAAIWYDGATGSISKVHATGIDFPPSCYGSGSPIGGTAFYVTSTTSPAHASTVTINQSNVSATVYTSTSRADLLAGSYTNAPLSVHAVPASFHTGYVLVGGFEFSATKDNSTNIYLTGTAPEEIPSGSLVNYSAYTGSYNKNGIACDDTTTTCTITNNTVTGEGPTNGIGQNGILVFGAGDATVTGNTVSGDTWTGGGAGSNGTGIYFLNAAEGTISGNTASSSDANIYVGLVQAYSGAPFPGYPSSFGATTVANNTVSGATSEGLSSGSEGYGEGIWLDGDDALPANEGGVQTSLDVETNTATGNAQAGIFSTGSLGTTITQNTIDLGNEAGMVFAGPSSECVAEDGGTPNPYGTCGISTPANPGWGSDGNAIVDNTVGSATPGDGNLAGVLMDGYYGNGVEGVSSDPAGSELNVLENNAWQGNTLADAVDLSGSPTNAEALGNTYGSGAQANMCTPFPGAAPLADAILGPSVTVHDVTVAESSPDLTDNSGNFPTTSANPAYPGNVVVTGGLAVDLTTSASIPAGDLVSSNPVTGNTVDLVTAPTGTGASDTIGFYNISDCAS